MDPCFRPTAALAVCLFAAACVGQTQAPSMPAPKPATSYPSIPFGTPSPAAQVSPTTPASSPQSSAAPAQPATPASATPAGTAATAGTTATTSTGTAPSDVTAPAYVDPLEKPLTIPTAGAPTSFAPTAIMAPSNAAVASVPSEPAYVGYVAPVVQDHLGSTYISVDSFIYPMALRLYSLGYLDSAFLALRPWTRRSLLHMLENSAPDIRYGGNEEAEGIYAALMHELAAEDPGPTLARGTVTGVYNVYDRVMVIEGAQPLHDSFHVGQTIANDYGRPYAHGFNNVAGFTTVSEVGRFSLYVRGEYQHSPAFAGYTLAQATQLSAIDGIIPFAPPQDPQATIPYGNTGAQNPFRLMEATLSVHLLSHEISGGKSDVWFGPGYGSAMNYSNNAEDVYSFRINRVEPLHIPLLSRVIGPLRYDFLVGSLKGHSYPNEPWMHSEAFSFAPTGNFQFTFQRTGIWGGHGHGCYVNNVFVQSCDEPITIHTFLKSFFSITDTTNAQKYSRDDPGARFSSFSFSWRLPFLTHRLTLYTDSTTHDDVTPISAPRRAGWRPGLYLAQVPYVPKLDFRVEGVYTDYRTSRSISGQGNYVETVQRQGYTNKGFLFGDSIGREARGGQAWLTYHLSPEQSVQVSYLKKINDKDFIPSGSTQDQFTARVMKRFHHDDIELNAWAQFERYNAPFVTNTAGSSPQHDTTVAAQVTFYPKLKTGFKARASEFKAK